jgi:hypothetical protein
MTGDGPASSRAKKIYWFISDNYGEDAFFKTGESYLEVGSNHALQAPKFSQPRPSSNIQMKFNYPHAY